MNKICDWCGKEFDYRTSGMSFHGTPPSPFIERLPDFPKLKNKNIWYICYGGHGQTFHTNMKTGCFEQICMDRTGIVWNEKENGYVCGCGKPMNVNEDGNHMKCPKCDK